MPSPHIAENVYYADFPNPMGPTHPNWVGTYSPPGDYNACAEQDENPLGNVTPHPQDLIT